MGSLTRTVLLGCVAALFAAAPALASPDGELEVYQYGAALGKSSVVDVALHVKSTDAPAAEFTEYVPQGYELDLSQPIGSQIGTTSVTMYRGSKAVFGDGKIFAEDPDRFVSNTCAPGAHAAVWLLRISIDKTVLRIPLYVDHGQSEGALPSSYTVHACLSAPESFRGLRLVWLDLEVCGFRNPTAALYYLWRALVTSYASDGTLDTSSQFEVQSNVPLPDLFTFRPRYDRNAQRVRISGALVGAGSPRTGVRIFVWSSPRRQSAPGGTPLATGTTDAQGRFSFSAPLPKTSWLYALADIQESPSCLPATAAPCVFATMSPPVDLELRVVVPKR